MAEVDKKIKAYTEKFGGFPYFLVMGADDDWLIELIDKALETGEEITAGDDGDY